MTPDFKPPKRYRICYLAVLIPTNAVKEKP